VQFVPLTFRPNWDTKLWELEEVNGLDRGDILSTRWIKLVLR